MDQKQDEAYQVAERAIELALREQATELDLSPWTPEDNKLTVLPRSLGQLVKLQVLDLSGNQLTTLPDWLDELTQLRRLDISNNYLMDVPDCIGQFEQLESLQFGRNFVTELRNWPGRMTHLQTLDLSYGKLKTLPTTFCELTQLQHLNLFRNELSVLPECLKQLTHLQKLDISGNPLTALPAWLGELKNLRELHVGSEHISCLPQSLGQLFRLTDLSLGSAFSSCQLTELPNFLVEIQHLQKLSAYGCGLRTLPDWLHQFTQLNELHFGKNRLTQIPYSLGLCESLTTLFLNSNLLSTLPESLGQLKKLRRLILAQNALTDLPASLGEISTLESIDLAENPLNPELAAARKEGREALKRYLRSKAKAQVTLHEAKLILVGEGEVGKSCLLGALRDDLWEEGRPTTHGIEIKSVKVMDPGSGTEITLNGWDFGGQRVYRPTHQLFFSAPAVYLVVWKPREGPQQGFVKEWIKLIKHREPDAKILVVATHGGPKERQPDIDRQEIWDLFGKDMVIDFLLVESKPDEQTQERKGIEKLKRAIAKLAASLPEIGRMVPQSWDNARKALKEIDAPYLALEETLKLCKEHELQEEEARDFIRVSHRLGHLIHYEHDPALRNIVILKPDWLTTAISFVLDDKQTRDAHGLVEFSRLSELWNVPTYPKHFQYDARLHPLFLRLMERFDISYKVAIPSEAQDAIGFWERVGTVFHLPKRDSSSVAGLHYTSLIAQLVPDVRPDPIRGWDGYAAAGDVEQSQICRITEIKSGQSAAAEGLFFQLIVRLHKYSLGRLNYFESSHWQRGLVLEDDYGARALLEHVGNDVRITVRSPYPERFLAALTYEVKWLVENFWAGLRCDVMVPCLNPVPCSGLFEVRKLIENKKRNRPEQPCPVCNEWQNIGLLLHNAPAARPNPLQELLANSEMTIRMLSAVRSQLSNQVMGRFDSLEASSKELVSKVEAAYAGLIQTLTDEAKDGPRLFSFEPVDSGFFDRPKWISEKFRITLWCEHSRLPLPALNGAGDTRGVYELTLPRDWVVKAAPFLKVLAGTLSLVIPVAASATKFALDDASYKGIEKELDLSQKSLTSVLKGGEQAGSWLAYSDAPDVEKGQAIRAEGSILRQLHAWLREKDASFGGLVRVQNKRQEFLWVHPQFEHEY